MLHQSYGRYLEKDNCSLRHKYTDDPLAYPDDHGDRTYSKGFTSKCYPHILGGGTQADTRQRITSDAVFLTTYIPQSMYQGSAYECFAQQRAVHTFGSDLGDFYWSDNEERRMNTLEGYHNHYLATS
jgi:hypothetical protein